MINKEMIKNISYVLLKNMIQNKKNVKFNKKHKINKKKLMKLMKKLRTKQLKLKILNKNMIN